MPLSKSANHNAAAAYQRLCVLSVFATTALTPFHAAFAGGEIFNPVSIMWVDGISGNGQYVAGSRLDDDGNFRAVMYSDGVSTDIGGLFGGPYNDTEAYAVSNGGTVTGHARNSTGTYNAFRWNASRGIENLGTLTGTSGVNDMSAGLSISNDGTRIVGHSSKTGSGQFAFAWIEGATTGVANNRQMYELGGLSAGEISFANNISGNGNYAVGGAMVGGL